MKLVLLLLAAGGCAKLKQATELRHPADEHHYVTASVGAGMTDVVDAQEVDPQAGVRYHYGVRVPFRLGIQARSTLDVGEVGLDLELYPLLVAVAPFVSSGWSHGYAAGDAVFLEAGVRFEVASWPSDWMPNDTSGEAAKRLGLSASYSTRFADYPDTLWLSLWIGYVPALPDDPIGP